VEIRIRAAEDEGSLDLSSLYQWLVQDPDVRQSVVVRLEPAAGNVGEMGVGFDAIIAIVSNAIALGSLIVAYMSWRDSRQKSPSVSIQNINTVFNLSDSSPETVSRIVEALSGELES
jgi:hypothetical protein